MSYSLLFIVGMFAMGLTLVLYARPIAVWDYNLDLRWKITFGIGISFRVWFFRVAGLTLAGTALFVLVRIWTL